MKSAVAAAAEKASDMVGDGNGRGSVVVVHHEGAGAIVLVLVAGDADCNRSSRSAAKAAVSPEVVKENALAASAS
jgi:hypothetical protein